MSSNEPQQSREGHRMMWIILLTGFLAAFWGWFFNWLFEPVQTGYVVFYYLLPFVVLGFLPRTSGWLSAPRTTELTPPELTFWGIIPLARFLKFCGFTHQPQRPQSALIAQDVLPLFLSAVVTPIRKKDRQAFHDFLTGLSRRQKTLLGKVFVGSATPDDYAQLRTAAETTRPHTVGRLLQSWRLWLAFAVQFAVVALLFGAWCFVNVWYQLPSRPQLDALADHVQFKLTKNGDQIDVNRIDWINDLYVPLADVPEHFRKALLFREDRLFYEHRGVTLKGLARTFFKGGGGSTITQQLGRNVFLSIGEPNRLSTLRRKLKEVIFALKLERCYQKAELLEMYLNKIAFGPWMGCYGIEIGARTYFQKHARDLNLYESALLVQANPNPAAFNFKNHEDRARQRAAHLLTELQANGVFSTQAIERALRQDVAPGKTDVPKREMRYLLDWIRPQIENEAYFRDISGEFTVVTTLNAKMQAYAEQALNTTLTDAVMQAADVAQVALVALAPDGAVQAMIGGRDYAESQFDRVTSAKRQPGSAFKLFVYLAALQQGWKPDDTINDAPITVNNHEITNDDEPLGPITLTRALALSRNPPAVSLIQDKKIGVETVIKLAHQLGITAELPPTPLLALGVSEVNVLELTGAYTVLANGGFAVKPYGVTGVRTKNGHIRYWRQPSTQRILDKKIVTSMNQMLTAVITDPQGTGRRANFTTKAGKYAIAGKTGTTNDYRDAWFIGFTADLCTGVWVGNDENTPMNRISGGRLPAEIFSKFMQAAHDALGLSPKPLP